MMMMMMVVVVMMIMNLIVNNMIATLMSVYGHSSIVMRVMDGPYFAL